MPFELILPDIGEGVVEAEIQRWFVRPGDVVEEDQPLVEVMTDKATVTIPSPRRGRVVRLRYREGEVAKVHEALLEIDEEPGSDTTPERMAAPTAAGAPKALATPAVRSMARQLGLDVSAIRGTGPGGRVTKDDLRHATGGGERPRARNGHQNGRGAPPYPDEGREGAQLAPDPQRPEPVEAPEQAERAPVDHGDEVIPLRGVRRRIAERMAQSKRTAAHFTFVEQVDVTELTKVKDRMAAAARDDGVKMTFLPFVVKAVVTALRKHPWLNSVLDEARGEIRLRREYHIGIASATEQGLVVPVIRHADRLSLRALAREIERLSTESKEGRVRPADLGGSTFTVTSLGARGGLLATPIINFPEVGILGVHRIRPTPVVRDGQIVARDVMNVSLSFDHRVVDGHVGAAFAYAVIELLEDPSLLFMEMV
jgi:pyruvate dehydrogenase E2 component (dihydrolipoamide acetyltransferase)